MKRLPKIKIRMSAGPGVYGWDLGRIAFGDPLELAEVHVEKNRKAREKYKEKSKTVRA